MARIFTLIFCLAATVFTHAQSQVSANIIPSAGDTLRLAYDNIPQDIEIGKSGGPRIFSFGNLESPYTNLIIFQSPAKGAWAFEFEEANLMAKLPGGGEAYYNRTNTKLELIGYYGLDPLKLGVNGICRYLEPKVEMRAPLKFLERKEVKYSLQMDIAMEDIPGGLLDSLPITPDSLRINIDTKSRELVDAYGRIQIPGNLFPTLRVKTEEQMTVSLQAKLPFTGWQDVTKMLPNNDFFGKRVNTEFRFFTEREKGPIVTVETKGRRGQIITGIRFRDLNRDKSTSSNQLKAGEAGIMAFPNPAIESTRFEFVSLQPGNYDLVIYNILGLPVFKENYFISGSKTVQVDLMEFKKGTYLYSLIDESGKTISSKKLVIIRP